MQVRSGMVLALLGVCLLRAGAPENEVRLQDWTNAGQSARPFTMGRYFAQGEAAPFAMPLVNGQEPSRWQIDVKTRWRDRPGVARQIGSCTATRPAVCTIVNGDGLAFLSGDEVTVAGSPNAALNGRWKVTRERYDAYVLLGSDGRAGAAAGGTMTGPGFGSVRWGAVTFWAALPAPVTVGRASMSCTSGICTANLANHGLERGDAVAMSGGSTATLNRNHIVEAVLSSGSFRFTTESAAVNGGQSAVVARFPETNVRFVPATRRSSDGQGLTAAEALAAHGGDWDVQMRVTGPTGSAQVVSARQMLADGNCQKWLDGPAATEFLCEDVSRARKYDFGWRQPDVTLPIASIDPATELITLAEAPPVPLSEGMDVVLRSSAWTPPGGTSNTATYKACDVTATTLKLGNGGCTNRVNITAAGAGLLTLVVQRTGTLWVDDTQYRALHPRFGLRFVPGWSGVQADVVLDSYWTHPVLDQTYRIEIDGRFQGATQRLYEQGSEYAVQSVSCSGGNCTLTLASTAGIQARQWFRVTGVQGLNGLNGLRRVDAVSGNTIRVSASVSGTYVANTGLLQNWHYARTGFRQTAWLGTAPGTVRIDHNLAYLAYSKALPMYDPQVTQLPYLSRIMSRVNQVAGEALPNGQGGLFRNFGTTGGRDDIGILPQWDAQYLYTFLPELEEANRLTSNASFHVPVHAREGTDETNRYYIDLNNNGGTRGDAADAASGEAFGRIASIDARPTLNLVVGVEQTAADIVQPATTLAQDSGWLPDTAHQPNLWYVNTLLKADPWLLSEAQHWALYVMSGDRTGNSGSGRRGSWAAIGGQDLQIRALAWSWRTMGHATLLTPDGTPEKALLFDKMERGMARFEGMNDIRNGFHFNPCDGGTEADPCPNYNQNGTSRAQVTTWTWANRSGTNMPPFNLLPNPLGFPFRGAIGPTPCAPDLVRPGTCTQNHSQFHNMFLTMVTNHLYELGYRFDMLRQQFGRFQLNMLRNPAMNPYLSVLTVTTLDQNGRYTSSWGQLFSSYIDERQALTVWPPEPYCGSDGYQNYMLAVVAMHIDVNDGWVRGEEAWRWAKANILDLNPNRWPGGDYNRGCSAGSPELKFAIVPRRDPTRLLPPVTTATTARVEWVAPTTTACTVTINGANLTPNNETDRLQSVTVSGLSGATRYPYTVNCAADPYGAQTNGALLTR